METRARLGGRVRESGARGSNRRTSEFTAEFFERGEDLHRLGVVRGVGDFAQSSVAGERRQSLAKLLGLLQREQPENLGGSKRLGHRRLRRELAERARDVDKRVRSGGKRGDRGRGRDARRG